MLGSELVAATKNACIDALIEAGFVRFRKDGVHWPLGNGFFGWVGLNHGVYAQRVELSPFLGIHCEPIHMLCARLEGRKYNPGIATISRHLGEICPDAPAFTFDASTDLRREAERLARLYVLRGLPYYEQHASYEAILQEALPMVDALGGYPETVASAYYLSGRVTEAREFAIATLARHPVHFAPFGEPFVGMLREKLN